MQCPACGLNCVGESSSNVFPYAVSAAVKSRSLNCRQAYLPAAPRCFPSVTSGLDARYKICQTDPQASCVSLYLKPEPWHAIWIIRGFPIFCFCNTRVAGHSSPHQAAKYRRVVPGSSQILPELMVVWRCSARNVLVARPDWRDGI